MNPVGGLRARLIRDSFYAMLNDALGALGWFLPDRQHLPVTFDIEPIDPLEEVKPNSIGLVGGHERSIPIELGSVMAEKDWMFFVDVFAENDTVGLHLSRDIQDILEGRMASIGRSTNTLAVYDYSQKTEFTLAPLIFRCLLEDVIVDRAHNTTTPWQRHWFAVAVTVRDTYRDENG